MLPPSFIKIIGFLPDAATAGSRSDHVVDDLFVDMIFIPIGNVLQLKILTLLLHKLDKVGAIDEFKMADAPVFVPVFRTVFGVNILSRINFYFELMGTPFKIAVHHHRNYFGITVLERLILDVDILRLRPLADPITILAMLRAIF